MSLFVGAIAAGLAGVAVGYIGEHLKPSVDRSERMRGAILTIVGGAAGLLAGKLALCWF